MNSSTGSTAGEAGEVARRTALEEDEKVLVRRRGSGSSGEKVPCIHCALPGGSPSTPPSVDNAGRVSSSVLSSLPPL